MKFSELPPPSEDIEMIKAYYSKVEPKPVSRIKLSDMIAQGNVAAEMQAEWADKLRADGWVQSEGSAWDEWTKEDPS